MEIRPKRLEKSSFNSIIDSFTNYLSYYISSMTNLKYHPSVLKQDGSLTLNLKNDKIFNIDPVATILKCIYNIDFDKQSVKIKSTFRRICMMIDPNELYKLIDKEKDKSFPIKFKEWKYKEIVAKQYKFKDGSLIGHVIDPYRSQFGIFVGFSKQFNELDYGYNYLHLFEHTMCIEWKNEPHQDNIGLNGYTSIVGTACVYSIDKTQKTFNKKLTQIIKSWFKKRTIKYWKENSKAVDTEIKRTFSETFEVKSLHDYFRTDQSILNNMDRTFEIFTYFASSPLRMLIFSPTELQCDLKIINKLNRKYPPVEHVPKKLSFDYIPLSVLNDKIRNEYRIVKLTKKELKKILNGQNKYETIGLDCKLICNMFMPVSVLKPLLTFQHNVNFEKYVKNIDLPLKITNLKFFAIEPYCDLSSMIHV